MGFYLITWDETDSNDTTVYDTVVESENKEAAFIKLSDHVQTRLIENKVEFESDGSEFGFIFNCTESCSEYCDGHGGISLREIEEFFNEESAYSSIPHYHTKYFID